MCRAVPAPATYGEVHDVGAGRRQLPHVRRTEGGPIHQLQPLHVHKVEAHTTAAAAAPAAAAAASGTLLASVMSLIMAAPLASAMYVLVSKASILPLSTSQSTLRNVATPRLHLGCTAGTLLSARVAEQLQAHTHNLVGQGLAGCGLLPQRQAPQGREVARQRMPVGAEGVHVGMAECDAGIVLQTASRAGNKVLGRSIRNIWRDLAACHSSSTTAQPRTSRSRAQASASRQVDLKESLASEGSMSQKLLRRVSRGSMYQVGINRLSGISAILTLLNCRGVLANVTMAVCNCH